MINTEANDISRRSVAILMGTFNGAEHLDEQLRSFADQTFSDWSLYVSDDGSTDSTCAIVRDFAASVPQQVELRTGPQTGFVDNFLTLARDPSIDAKLFAFSDQDDVWYPEKLARAVSWFDGIKDETMPALYFSRTELIDQSGRRLGYSTRFRKPPAFRNALVQNIGGANTMVFNQAARRLVQAAAGAPAVAHDWTLYLLVTAVGGMTIYDPVPTLKYRQHDGNVMGTNRGFRAIAKRTQLVFKTTLRSWYSINQALLARINERLTPANRETLWLFSAARAASLPTRMRKLKQSGVYRQTGLGTAGLLLAALLGKI